MGLFLVTGHDWELKQQALCTVQHWRECLVFGPPFLLLQSKMQAQGMIHHNMCVVPPQWRQSRQYPTDTLIGQPDEDKPPSRLFLGDLTMCQDDHLD